MKRTPTQDKALAWYCETYSLTPQLSTHPLYYFKDSDGVESTRLIEHIVMEYKRRKDEKELS